MEISNSSYDASTGIYSYKKDGQWFFSTCPPDQIASRRVDGKWYFVELCVGGGGGDSDVSKMYVDSQDQKLQANIDKCFSDSKDYTDGQIGGLDISVDLSEYASQEWVLDQSYITEQPVTDGDAATLSSANKYTDEQIAAIEIPEGADLSAYTEKTYVDGADQAVQRFATTADEVVLNAAKKYTDDSLGTIPEVSEPDVDKEYVDNQDATKIGNTGEQVLPSSTWKLRAKKVDDSGAYSYIAIQDDHLKLYHVADPTADAHGMSRGFADSRYQFIQQQIVFKCDQYAKCSTSPNPAAGEFCGLNNSSPGSSTSPNPYFGNWNVGIRIAADKLLNPEGSQFADMERYTIEGTVTILDKTGKLYFKAAVHSVTRTNNNSYIDINFGSRVPAFGTGSYDSSDQYVVLVEGLETVQPTTTNIPEE